MILNSAQIKELRELALPLMAWLEANTHPHCQIMVNSESAVVTVDSAIVRKDQPKKEDGE